MSMGEEIEINVAQTEDEASQIDSYVSALDTAFDELVTKIDKAVNNDIQTDWGAQITANLQKYRKNTMDDALADMHASATNLRATADAADRFSKEEV